MLPRIERYEISQEIGHGGMATVYRARDARLDRWVAVKVMHPHLRGAEQARVRFAREARAVAKLKHPSILEIYDYSGADSDNAYIATELLTGPTLRGFVEEVGDVPAEIAACIGVELASALAAAHAEGIVHRDVKPENVLLHDRKLVKLTDFGIAAMVDPGVSHMTATGQILGSPAHMAPEQVEGADSDVRSDIFALGTILYWLATGTLPFSGKNAHQVLKRVVDCQPVDPLLVRPSIGRPLRDVILRCLAKDPEQRYQSADELMKELSRLLERVAISDPVAQLAAYLREPKQEAEAIRERVINRLLGGAAEDVRRQDRIQALDKLDRILALDDGNPVALGLIDELERGKRRRVVARGALLLAGVAMLFALWVTFTPASEAVTSHVSAKSEQTVQKKPDAPSQKPAAALAVPPSTKVVPKLEPAQPIPKPTTQPVLRPRPRPTEPKGDAPRTVQFDPDPANVTISVDGAPARAFGPAFRMVELSPGKHSFLFEGAHECCTPQTIELNVPPGPGTSVVSAKLAFRAARLYVATDAPADVLIEDGRLGSGRARSLLNVPIERSLVETRRISVTAPGYEPYTATVQLRAGQVTQLNVDLVPSAAR